MSGVWGLGTGAMVQGSRGVRVDDFLLQICMLVFEVSGLGFRVSWFQGLAASGRASRRPARAS